jgi:ankyrin repeat protein
VNYASEGFWTPFLQAVKYGHNEIAKYLVEKGATPQNDKSKGEVMYDAAYRNNVEMIRVMMGLGMKPDQRDFTQALFGKAYDAAKVIITEGGVDINSNQHGALVYAIRSLTPEAVKFCLDNGADVAGTLADVKANTQWARNEEKAWKEMIASLEALAPKQATPDTPKPPQP